MKNLQPFTFNLATCEKEINEFEDLLSKKSELKESQDVLPFFKKRQHLSAFIAAEIPKIVRYDLIAHEFPLFGEFQADLVIGDSISRNFCLIEFEDAKSNSLFVKNNTYAMKFASRFERGFSQIIDWYRLIDDLKNSTLCKKQFSGKIKDYHGLLIIGRDEFLGDNELKKRIDWRSEKIIIDSKTIFVYTYDQLLIILKDKVEYFKMINK